MSSCCFIDGYKTSDAVERCLARISEAATKLGPLAENTLSRHSLAGYSRHRQRSAHEYDRLEKDRIWFVVEDNLPPLRTAAQAALRSLLESEAGSA
jgi:uncharacterized protein with HEPN domain